MYSKIWKTFDRRQLSPIIFTLNDFINSHVHSHFRSFINITHLFKRIIYSLSILIYIYNEFICNH